MASPEELVSEFRSVVDLTIEQQLSKRGGTPIFRGGPTVSVYGMEFSTAKDGQGRSIEFRLDDEMWAIKAEERVSTPLGKASLAFVSYKKEPESLTRTLAYLPGASVFPVVTAREIEAQNELENVLKFIKSPLLSDALLDSFAVLDPAEEVETAHNIAEVTKRKRVVQRRTREEMGRGIVREDDYLFGPMAN